MCLLLLLLWWAAPVLAEGFRCAGWQGMPGGAAAKPARLAAATGPRQALVLFARFKGESTALPSWTADLFDPDLPGSIAHFYHTMSFGKLRVRGQVAPRVYESAQPATAYLEDDQTPEVDFGRFSLEILRQADRDIDLAQFDNDGPDGVPNSGDDDGAVDAMFLVLARVPANFLQGEATGVANLGFAEVLPTSDPGAKGKAILIFPGQGTLQQGRYFAEAVGAICHEYGHVLGLPDLYNTDFLGKAGVGPEEDSAGVGAWCLMGWGASGWNGDDGPNSFCAWSRMKLGWSPVISLSRDREQLKLQDVGQGGAIFQLPVNDRETFLLEYRRRDGNYYDRHVPGEGVLIWHEVPRPLIERKWSPVLVDLECADGRWQDAGYPQGREPDSAQGGDNLDFWAHDQGYLKAHGGNLGDATDPFDGVRFSAFTPETNPSAHSDDGQSSVRVENIRIEEGVARMEVRTAPRLLAVENVRLNDASGDGVIAAEEEVGLLFWVANRGGVEVADIKAALSSEDTLVEILHREKPFGDLRVGRTEVGSFGQPFPRFRLRGGFAGAHAASLRLDLYSGGEKVGQHPFVVVAGAARQQLQEVSLIDSAGNGDDQAQAGEIVQLSIALASQHEAVLPAVGFLLRALDTRVQQLGSPAVFFRMVDASLALSTKGPEFLLPSTLEADAVLPFELEVKGIGSWKDTIEVQVREGRDQTPPRVNLLRVQVGAREGLDMLLADRWVVDGSPLRSARAVFYNPRDTALVAEIPLERQGEGFAGSWREAPPGSYLVAGEVEDAEGNRGRSPLLRIAALLPGSAGGNPALAGGASLWEPLHLSTAQSAAEISLVAIAPGDPKVVYAAGPASLWRSEDGGQTWNKTGLMFNGLYYFTQLSADPQAPGTVYLSEWPLVLKSSDGGRRWAPMGLPDQNLSLRVDLVLPGRLYGYSYALQKLLISEDEGQSWRESGLVEYPSLLVTHPTAPQHLYAGVRIGPSSEAKGVLWHSGDGGHTWQGIEQGQVIRGLSPDPRDPNALYGAGVSKVLYSPDLGRTWQELGGVAGGIDGIQVHARAPEVVYAWGGSKLWVSRDSGKTWKVTGLPGGVKQLALNPEDPSQLLLVLALNRRNTLWRCWDFGEQQALVEIYQEDTPAGALAFTPKGQPFVASLQGGAPGFFTQVDGGRFWEWRESPALYGILVGNSPTFFEMLYIDPLWPQIMIAHHALGINQFVRSADGGKTWERMKMGGGWGSAYGGPRYAPKVVSRPRSPGVYFLISRIDASLQRSVDFGETWEQAGRMPVENTSFMPGLVVDPLNDETFYVAANENTWFSEDAGQHWTEIGPVRQGEFVLAMAFHPEDLVSLYAVTSAGIYLSEDRARTWELVFRPPGMRWSSAQLRFDPHNANHLYLVTSRALYESGDAGRTWMDVGQQFEGSPWFNDLAFDPFDASLVYVTTTWGVYKLDRTPIVTAVEEIATTPATFSLSPAYPNPFNPSTTIHFTLSQPGEAELSIYNLLGQKVTTLVQGIQDAGPHVLQWNGRDDQGRELASGVYLCRLRAGGRVETRKVLLLR